MSQPNMKKILICNLYRPPQGQLDTIANKFNSPPEIFITGDFNVNYKDTQDEENLKRLKWLNMPTVSRNI